MNIIRAATVGDEQVVKQWLGTPGHKDQIKIHYIM